MFFETAGYLIQSGLLNLIAFYMKKFAPDTDFWSGIIEVNFFNPAQWV